MKLGNASKLFICVIVCQGAGILGSFAGQQNIPVWYSGLEKSPLTPPNWVFPVVWITLYFMMAIAAYFVWKRGFDKPLVKPAMAMFVIQLALNAAWTPLFFGAQEVYLALIDIVLMVIATAVTIYLFYRIEKSAAYLLIPYFAWISFATYLNYEVLRLNF